MDELNLNPSEGASEVVGTQTETQATEQENASTESAIGEVATPQQNEKPVQSAEENARFAQVRREAEQKAYAKAQDELISNMYGVSHGIHTYAEYQAALDKQEQEQRLSELLEQNIPEEYATEMLENRKFREQFEAEKQAKEQQKQQQADFQDFMSAFPDVKAEEIPTEVWQANAKGIPLRYAYAEHALKLTREVEAKAKANAENAKGSMGSITGDGVANESDFVSYDTFEANRSNQSWVNKNFNKIMKSRANW